MLFYKTSSTSEVCEHYGVLGVELRRAVYRGNIKPTRKVCGHWIWDQAAVVRLEEAIRWGKVRGFISDD